MTPRKTIGENPLDSIIPPREEPAAAPPPSPRKARPVPQGPPSGGKERLTVHLRGEVIERARNAVFWTPGLTLAGLAESAFLKALEKLEKENGGPFPPRKENLKGGRPMK